MTSFIKTYFLRVYASERKKGSGDEIAAYREALFQARFLAFLPVIGLGGAALVVVARSSPWGKAALHEYRPMVMGMMLFLAFLAAFSLVKHAVGRVENIPAVAEQHGSARDQMMIHVQFWCTLVGSLCLPFIAGVLLCSPVGHPMQSWLAGADAQTVRCAVGSGRGSSSSCSAIRSSRKPSPPSPARTPEIVVVAFGPFYAGYGFGRPLQRCGR
jgi:hypothetical protein